MDIKVVSDKDYFAKLEQEYRNLRPSKEEIKEFESTVRGGQFPSVKKLYIPSTLSKVMENIEFYKQHLNQVLTDYQKVIYGLSDQIHPNMDKSTIKEIEREIESKQKLFDKFNNFASVVFKVHLFYKSLTDSDFNWDLLHRQMLEELINEDKEIPYIVYSKNRVRKNLQKKYNFVLSENIDNSNSIAINGDNVKVYLPYIFTTPKYTYEKFWQVVLMKHFRYKIARKYSYEELKEKGISDRLIATMETGFHPDAKARLILGSKRVAISPDYRILSDSYFINNVDRVYVEEEFKNMFNYLLSQVNEAEKHESAIFAMTVFIRNYPYTTQIKNGKIANYGREYFFVQNFSKLVYRFNRVEGFDNLKKTFANLTTIPLLRIQNNSTLFDMYRKAISEMDTDELFKFSKNLISIDLDTAFIYVQHFYTLNLGFRRNLSKFSSQELSKLVNKAVEVGSEELAKILTKTLMGKSRSKLTL